jgi:chorismate mutase
VTTIKRNRDPRAMSKTLRGLRGATTAATNTGPAILDATAELLRALQQANGFRPEEIESAIFTSSPDLTAEYPARAARLLGWRDVPLLGAAEVAVPDGLPRCIRVLLHFYTTKSQRELKHMYLGGAATLRPDRTQ